jgi:hypothetical protein
MSKFFVFRFLKNWKPGDLPMNAAVSIGVVDQSVRPTGEVLISAQLMTDQEVDFAIDGIINELEQIRKSAKAAIKADNSRVETSVASRLNKSD